ncbi:MAG: ribosome small subunit-dependent GTPase, partial [Candidatus Hydrogenedentes bacterium]|nr:ribosome small subunit-dependent GTPase [Candidatus Hydrogenedentota bacterium]
MFLERLGADQTVYGAFSPYARQQMVLARVAVAQRDVYQLYTEDGFAHAEPSGRLYYHTPGHSSFPVTGDWVAARIVGPEQALVEAVLPRRTCLSRRAAGRREEEQPLAANVDVVFLVCGLDGDFNLRRLER